MLRLKIFSTATYGGDIGKLEEEINGWLESAQPAIRQMLQSGGVEHTVISFLYETGEHGMQTHVASAVVPEAIERSLDGTDLDPVEDEPTLLPDAELPY
jgi:hypothetical protein